MIAQMDQAQAIPSTETRAVPWDRPRFDVWLLGAVLVLIPLGITMVYSASAMRASVIEHKDSAFYLKRQLAFALAGLACMILVMKIGYRRLQDWAYPMLAVSGVLVLATFIPGIGVNLNHAQRWIRLPGFNLEPSEFACLALCVYLARSVSEKGEALKDFRLGFLPHALVVGVFCAMVLAQPDFGTMIVMLMVMFLVLFVAGARMSYVAIAGLLAVPLACILVATSPYRMRRVQAFLDPFGHQEGSGFQVVQALTSIGSGGVFGLGLGQGREKLGYLPEGHTDYILASIGEELGLLGIAIVLGLFVVIIWRGLRTALRAPDAFGSYLAFGITSLLAVEVIINAGMCVGLLPSKGLALPFLSYGGTSLIKSMIATGILLSISSSGSDAVRPAAGLNRRP